MKVLVTGGAGYIGAELVFKLSQNPEVTSILVFDNLSRGNINLFVSNRNKIEKAKVEFIHGDLLDSRKLKAAMNGVDIVYHLAATTTSISQSVDSSVFEQTNHWGTAEVVYAAEEEESVTKFVYLSNTGIYQGGKNVLCDETSTLNPRDFYSIGKMRGEEHVARLKDKMNAVILRVGNVYGYSPAIRFDSVINTFLFDAQFNNKISIHGSGKQIRPFIALDKVIDVLNYNVSNELPSDVYNLSDKNLKILDLVDVFKEVYPDLEFIFINQHIEMKNLQIADCDKIKEYVDIKSTDLKEEIIAFKENSFAF
jgi:UDP-glucose 4-epimerase